MTRLQRAVAPWRPCACTSTVTFVAPVAGRTRPHSEKPWPRLVTVSGTGQRAVQRLGLPLTYSRPVWKPTAAVDARAGRAADRVVFEQVLREGRHAGVVVGDVFGDRVVFGLLGDGHAEVLVGLALHAELGQVDRHVRRDRVRARRPG